MMLLENASAVMALVSAEIYSFLGTDLVMFAVAAVIYAAIVRPRKAATSQKKIAPASVGAEVWAKHSEAGAKDDRARGDRRASRSPKSSGTTTSDLQQQVLLIKKHARDRDMDSAVAVFSRWQKSGAGLSPVIYNCFLDACVQCGDLERANTHFEEMKQLNCVDIVGYNTILKAHLLRGKTEEARALVHEMAGRGLQANSVTYNELLNAKVVSKDRRGMWSVVDEMQEAGIRINSVTCSILLKSLTQRSNPVDVRRIMDLIDKVDEAIDEVLFSSLIEACISMKQFDLLLDVVRRYRDKGGFANLKVPTYGSMIKAFGQAGNVSCVRELWRDMEEQSIKPTSITLGCMVEALVVNGQADEAWDLIHRELESEERRSCVNTVIYTTALKGFLVTRRLDKVFVVYKEMRNSDITCNTITYNTILDACAKCSAMHRAAPLLEDMKAACVEPDIITYSTIIKGYCHEGDVDRAFSILKEMKEDKKLVPDEIMYNSILDGCAKQRRVDESLRILDEMKVAGIAPTNYTLSILVKLLGHARRLSQAFRMVEDISTQNGFRPNVQVYTCLMQACILNRRLDRALSLHDTMVSDVGCTADKKLYSVLVRGCLQLHQPGKAVEVVRAAHLVPGHSLKVPTGHAPAVGLDMTTLDELAARLQAGGVEEKHQLSKLAADLWEKRKVRINGCNTTSGSSSGAGQEPPWRGRPCPSNRR